MLTSILLYFALLPAPTPLDPGLRHARPGQAALGTQPGGEPGPLCLVRAEAADEESEEEDWDGPILANHPMAKVGDAHPILPARGSNGSPHLPLTRERRCPPRSPPRDHLLPAHHGVLASTG